jgi:uncharacterized protein (TIGR00369 family)
LSFDPAAAGWTAAPRSNFANLIGPVWQRMEGAERRLGFLAEERHFNPGGVVHGGMLMAFADEFLGGVVFEAIGQRPIVTIQLNTHFIATVQRGDFVEGRGEVVRRTRTIVFVRGMLMVGDRIVAAVDGIWKVLEPR